MKSQIKVRRFFLQPTPSFREEDGGAPQREEYLTDGAFEDACLVYQREWREMYYHDGTCKDRSCPQCFPSTKASLRAFSTEMDKP